MRSALLLNAARPTNRIASKLVIMTPPAVAMMVANLLRCDMSTLDPCESFQFVQEIHGVEATVFYSLSGSTDSLGSLSSRNPRKTG
jgi:hypothetical protein